MSLDVPLLAGVSDNDKRRWQIAAARALAEILKRAERQKLRPIEWRLNGGLHVNGFVHATYYGNVEKDVIAAFKQWCDLLCLTADPEVSKSGGGIYLVGRHDNWRPKPSQTGAKVSVIAQTFAL
jgi:hypothetical protein